MASLRQEEPQGHALALHATHLQATLNEIQEIANDVEMEPPPSEWGVYMILDTNILLGHYEAIRKFVGDVEKSNVPIVVVIPGIVVQELDRQKNSQKLAWLARRASGWLLEKVRLHRTVKVQATDETCKSSKNWRTKLKDDELTIPEDMMNDHLIIDCAQHFQGKLGNTILCSADNNLCIIAHSQGLPSMTPPRRAAWTSRDIVQHLYGPEFPLLFEFSSSAPVERVTRLGSRNAQDLRFGTLHQSAYSKAGSTAGTGGVRVPDDSDDMMIDDENTDSTEETPLNVLHDDVRDYFTRLLVQLVARVGGSDLKRAGDMLGQSRYAPGYMKKAFPEWGATECLEYLYDQSKTLRGSMVSPAPEVFLSKRYTARGARTGGEWSSADWQVALANVVKVGTAFGDGALEESVNDLKAYLGNVLQNIRR